MGDYAYTPPPRTEINARFWWYKTNINFNEKKEKRGVTQID